MARVVTNTILNYQSMSSLKNFVLNLASMTVWYNVLTHQDSPMLSVNIIQPPHSPGNGETRARRDILINTSSQDERCDLIS
jgi:hypothetical protein